VAGSEASKTENFNVTIHKVPTSNNTTIAKTTKERKKERKKRKERKEGRKKETRKERALHLYSFVSVITTHLISLPFFPLQFTKTIISSFTILSKYHTIQVNRLRLTQRRTTKNVHN
jgi:hypothetical protein